MSVWIELVTATVELILPLYFFSGVFGKSKEPILRKSVLAILYYVVLSTLSIYMEISFVRSAIIIIVTLIVAKLYYAKGWIQTLYVTILFFVFSIISDLLVGLILQTLGVQYNAMIGGGVYRVIYNASGKLLHLIILYLYITLRKPQILFNPRKSIPLLACQLLSIFLCFYSFISVNDKNDIRLVGFLSLGMLYINLVICIYVDELGRIYESEKNIHLVQQQLEIQKKHYEDVLNRQEEMRKLWHDIKKYVLTMEALVANENKAAAQVCLQQFQASVDKNENLIDTGNSIVDSIFNYGLKKADEAGVTIKADVWVDEKLSVSDADLFIIIGNTIDNAVEACSIFIEPELRIIQIDLVQNNHILLYEIRNHYSDNSPIKPGVFHGYGLKNVTECVKRNGGEISISKENNLFCVSISLDV